MLNAPLGRRLPVALLALLTTPVLAQPAAPEDEHYRAGIGLLNKGLDDAAAAELRASLKDRPDGPDAANAHYALGVCLWKLGRPSEAAGELDAALTREGFTFAADARLLRARCAEAAGDDRAVIAALRTLAKDAPAFDKLEQAGQCLAEAYYRTGDYAACRRALGSPASGRGLLFLAMAEAAMGEPAPAAGHAAEALAASGAGTPSADLAGSAALLEAQCRWRLGDTGKARVLYEKAASLGKDQVRAEALLGSAQLARAAADLPAAERALMDAAGLRTPAELGERIMLEHGKLLVDQSRPAEAAKALAPLLTSQAPRTAAEAALWSARAALAGGDAAAAARTLSEAAEKAPEAQAADLLFELPGALAAARDDAGALAAWDRWLARFAAHALAPDAKSGRAWALFRLNRLDECRAACGAFLKAHAKHPAADRICLLAAETEFAAGRSEAALAAYSDLLSTRPASPDAHRAAVRRGLCLQNLKRPAEAAKALEEALARPSANPADADLDMAATLTLGELAMEAGDWAAAARRFAPIAQDPKAGEPGLDAALRLGRCLSRLNKPAESLAAFDRVLAADKPLATARGQHAALEKAQALAGQNRPADAEPLLRAVLAVKPADGTIASATRRALADVAARQGRAEESARILGSLAEAADAAPADRLAAGSAFLAAGRYAEAERALTPLASPAKGGSAPQATADAARVQLAIAVNRQGRAREALGLLEAVASATLAEDLRAAGLYEKSLALRALKQPDEAARACRALLDLPAGPLTPYARLDLADAERAAGRHAEALLLAERVAADAAAPEALRARGAYMRAASQVSLGKPAEAAATLASFAQDHPKSDLVPVASLLRGEALLAAGRPAEAAEALAPAAGAGVAAEVRGPAMLRVAEAHAAARRWKDAEAACAAFLEAYPASDQWFRARFGLGMAREALGRHEDAIASYREVSSRHKGATAARAQFQIGECLYALKKLDQAVAEFAKVDVLFAVPEWSAAALYETGRCLAELQKPEDARRQYDDLLKRFPDSPWAKLARDRQAAAPTKAAALPGR